MYIKFAFNLFLISLVRSQEETQPWDLALAIKDRVLLLDSNGSVIDETPNQFKNLKALTYNHEQDQLLVSDMDANIDIIYRISMTNLTEIEKLVTDLPDDVQGLAMDASSNVLYWTDHLHHKINFVQLEKELPNIQRLFNFSDESPNGIAIDICNSKIYWTNSDGKKPSIESSSFTGKDRQILIDSDLFKPSGIAIDQLHQRIYWADMREGIYFSIESVNFDGKERQVLYNSRHQQPYGLAVDKNYVYWTDMTSQALWRKDINNSDEPEKISEFKDKPLGLVARNLGFPFEPNCNIEHETYAKESTTDVETLPNSKCNRECINGILTDDCTCLCNEGFNGTTCETSLCYNYCNNGVCHVNKLGRPQCRCKNGFVGERCDTNICNNYCLNGGDCTMDMESYWGASCTCRDGYTGSRCETKYIPINPDFAKMCALFCQNASKDVYVNEKNALICRCSVIEQNNITKTEENILNYFQDPIFLLMISSITVLCVLNCSLFGIVYRIKKMRPRIKKRIVVNKNITPLTYRPQSPIQQCEITIENCCNMNECETPCYEPPALRNFQSGKDEKKVLLANMEGEDF